MITQILKLEESYLPPVTKFYNRLQDSNITEHDYEHAELIWNHFNIQNLGEYCDLHLKTDIMLLCDIFKTCRDKAYKTYGLDSARFYTMPGYACDCIQNTS